MKPIRSIGLICCLLLATALNRVVGAAAQIEELPEELRHGYDGASFVDMEHGYLFGDDTIIATADGGATWRLVCNKLAIESVFFLDGQTFWVLSRGGELRHTDNGGETFTSSTVQFLDHVTGQPANVCGQLFFRTVASGWTICGRHVLKTADAGLTWTSYLLPRELGEPGRLWMFDALHGIAVQNSGQPVLHTMDGGATWTVLRNSPPLNQLSCTSAGYCAGLQGKHVFVSANAGSSWQDTQVPLQLPDRDEIGQLQALSPTLVLVVGSDLGFSPQQDLRPHIGTRTPMAPRARARALIMRFDGSNWTRLANADPPKLRGLYFVDSQNGWLVAAGSNLVYKTVDGGLTLTFVSDYFRQLAALTPSPKPFVLPTPVP
jgi:photosystem II stability/assembly factor-like uncharacterized protein